MINNSLDPALLDRSETFKQLLGRLHYPPLLGSLLDTNKLLHPHPLQKQFLEGDSPLSVMLSAQSAGKTLAAFLYAMFKVIQQESFLVFVVGPSKSSCQSLFANLSRWTRGLAGVTLKDVNFTKDFDPVQFHRLVLIGTWQDIKRYQLYARQKIDVLVVQQLDLADCFGYSKQVEQVGKWPIKQVVLMDGKARKFRAEAQWSIYEAQEDEQIQSKNRRRLNISQFYISGDELNKFVVLYVVFKLGYMNGKTLLLARDTHEAYRAYHFLDRIAQKNLIIYNHQNPKNLRLYNLSNFNSNSAAVMVATPEVLSDLSDPQMQTMAKKFSKRGRLQLRNVNNIITLSLHQIQNFQQLYQIFGDRAGLILNLVEQADQEELSRLFELEKQLFVKIKFREFPLKKNQIDSFRYRVNDLYSSLNKKNVQVLMQLDLKTKLLKARDMGTYFQDNPKQLSLLQNEIVQLRERAAKTRIVDQYPIPEYLVPDSLKTRKSIAQPLSRRPRLASVAQKVQVGQQGASRVYVDPQDNQIVQEQEQDRKPLTNRQLWKMRHGFSLKKRNKRNEKKGIFEAH